jgi:hypothetical protein
MDNDVKPHFLDFAAQDFRRQGGLASGVFGDAHCLNARVKSQFFGQFQSAVVFPAVSAPAWYKFEGDGELSGVAE